MEHAKLCIVMVGLPARGKSTIASKLKENLIKDGVKARIFNNGDLRRKFVRKETSSPEFYDPKNSEAVAVRENIALKNIRRAKEYLGKQGQVAILDATNASLKRRQEISNILRDHPLLFIECINGDEKILEASILRKIALPEFRHLEKGAAIQSFKQRIMYYNTIYCPLKDEINRVKLDSLNNNIMEEEIVEHIPYYDRIRDFLVTDTIKTLCLLRTGGAGLN